MENYQTEQKSELIKWKVFGTDESIGLGLEPVTFCTMQTLCRRSVRLSQELPLLQLTNCIQLVSIYIISATLLVGQVSNTYLKYFESFSSFLQFFISRIHFSLTFFSLAKQIESLADMLGQSKVACHAAGIPTSAKFVEEISKLYKTLRQTNFSNNVLKHSKAIFPFLWCFILSKLTHMHNILNVV